MTPAPTPHPARATAHGRVNLIGEHTDYNDGFVLPTLIPQRTQVTVRPRAEQRVTVRSDAVGDARPDGRGDAVADGHRRDGPRDAWRDGVEYVLGQERRCGGWLDYVQGVTWALRAGGVRLEGGFELTIMSDVPLGAGVSSSAALEVSVLRALRDAFSLDGLDDVRVAQVAQRAENEFVGARSGIMDQMAASLADPASALFLDTRSLSYRKVTLPQAADFVVIHSGITHSVAGGDYNTRRAECEAAAAALGVTSLRDLSTDDLPRVGNLPEPLDRRVRHVVTENARVLEAVDALERGDLDRLGSLFHDSHVSMRDDYEVSVPEIDGLVEIAERDPDVYGARLTGGGFGGSVVILARGGTAVPLAERVAREYAALWRHTPRVLVPTQHTAA